MPATIQHRGPLILDCTIPGEGRDVGAMCAHPNGIQVSRDRWLMVYATRRFRGGDDDCSIVWQLRRDSPAGAVISEGLLARSYEYDPIGDGRVYWRQHGHPVAFGVPRGALIGGRVPPHANLFVVKWRVVARVLQDGRLMPDEPEVRRRTQDVEWAQLRLNEAEDGIEVAQPPARLRQRGYEGGPQFCAHEDAGWMNQSFVQAVPWNAEATEWADCNHFLGGRIAALKYRYDPARGVYEWVEVGPLVGNEEMGLFEASLVPWGGGWVISARTRVDRAIAWLRTDDPFARMPEPLFSQTPRPGAPLTAYRAADGSLRLFSGDAALSPVNYNRDPLFCWEIDPEHEYRPVSREVVMDARRDGLPHREGTQWALDMCKLLPHAGGREQFIVHRVRPNGLDYATATRPEISDVERAACGIYHAVMSHPEDLPGMWEFG